MANSKKTNLYMHKEVVALLKQYNTAVEKDDQVAIDDVVAALAKAGGSVPAVAANVSFEEIEAANVPTALARTIGTMWRTPAEPEAAAKAPASETQMSVGGMTGGLSEFALALGRPDGLSSKLLLTHYEPLGRQDIHTVLNERAQQHPFIVFANKEALQVDVEASEGLLNHLQQGVDLGGDTYPIDGKLRKLYRAGELPDAALPICPLHDCHLTGPTQFCPQCARNWNEVEGGVRELAWLQVNEVTADPVGGAEDPVLIQMWAAVAAGEADPYWGKAELEREQYTTLGKQILLVKPLR